MPAGNGFKCLLHHFCVDALMLSRMGHEETCGNNVSEYPHSAILRFAAKGCFVPEARKHCVIC